MRIGALIPAKLTSTRLQRKNLLPLNGKPLVYWSVKNALDTDIFSDVTVSSESDEVLDTVRTDFGPSDVRCLKRPSEMSSTYASLRDVMKHYASASDELDYISLFMPTSPFRRPDRIRNEIAPHLSTGRLERVLSLDHNVTPTVDYFIREDNGCYAMVFLPNIQYCYHCNSAYLVTKVSSLFKDRTLRGNESLLRIACSFSESVDINTSEEYEIALKVATHGEPIFRRPMFHEVEGLRIVLPEGADVDDFLSLIDSPCLADGRLKVVLDQAPNHFILLDIQQAIEQGMQGMPFYLSRRHDWAGLEHSQLQPEAFLRNPFYAISSSTHSLCRWGEKSLELDPDQVIWQNRLLEWHGYVEPFYWDAESPEDSNKGASA